MLSGVDKARVIAQSEKVDQLRIALVWSRTLEVAKEYESLTESISDFFKGVWQRASSLAKSTVNSLWNLLGQTSLSLSSSFGWDNRFGDEDGKGKGSSEDQSRAYRSGRCCRDRDPAGATRAWSDGVQEPVR